MRSQFWKDVAAMQRTQGMQRGQAVYTVATALFGPTKTQKAASRPDANPYHNDDNIERFLRELRSL